MDKDAILADYQALRAKIVPLSGELTKLLSRDDLHTAARRLEMLHDGQLYFQTEDEVSVLMDYAIHEIYRDGENAVGRMLRNSPYAPGSEEMRLLLAMREAKHVIFETMKVIPGFAVIGKVFPSDDPIYLVDLGFSRSAEPGLGIATHLISPGPGWSMTTGAALPMIPEGIDAILQTFKDFTKRHGTEPPEAQRTIIIIRELVKAKASSRIHYASPGENENSAVNRPSPIIRRETKVGRNDACPCGSGKKYKRCCGASYVPSA